MEINFENFLRSCQQNFCLCDVDLFQINPLLAMQYEISRNNFDYEKMLKNVESNYACSATKEFKRHNTISDLRMLDVKESSAPRIKRRANKKLILELVNLDGFVDDLLRLFTQVLHDGVVIMSKRKSTRTKNMGSGRSKFIGVSMNGPNWQALISVNKKKTYIGTFTSQYDAAKEYDKYSIVLNNLSAKTNFNYTKDDILCIAKEFLEKRNLSKNTFAN